jgi:cytochrome c-type biogenesis protein CcmH
VIRILALVALVSVAPSGAAWAKEAVPMAEDPALEQRLFDLSVELRCLVCQNQTLAESDAELAQDLRREIRDMMKRGMDDAEIIDFLVQRYGDFVLYRPPFKATTALLWFGPLILIAIAAVLWIVTVRQRRSHQEAAPLSAEEAQRLNELLE